MRKLVALVGAVVFVDTMFFTALAPLLPEYADDLGLTKAQAGILAGAYPAGVLLGGIPSGILATRLGVKRTLLGGLALLAVTTIVFGLADQFWLLASSRLAQGLASACAWTAGFTWLVNAAPTARRGALIGSALGLAIAGALFGPVLGAAASIVGTGPAFGAVGAAALGLGVWAASTPAPAPGEPQALGVFVRSLGDRAIQSGLWLIVLPALLFGTLSVLAPLDLADLGVGPVAIGAVFLVSAAGEATLAPLVGRLSDRRGRLLPLRIGLVGSTLATLLLAWPDRRVVLAVVVVLAGCCFGIFWAPAMAWLTDSAERRALETAYVFALMNLAWAPGQTIGSAVGGTVADLTSDAVPWLTLAGLCVATLVALRAPAMRPAREAP